MAGTVAVTGVGGAQAGAIADAFRRADWAVRGISRGAGADVESGHGLAAALEGADALVFTVPQDHRDGAWRRMAAAVSDAAARAGVGRVVLNLAGTPDPAGGDPLSDDLHAVWAAFEGAGPEAVTLVPTVYLDNILAPWAQAAMAEGALPYPAPADAPVAWLSHRSLGAFAVAAAERGEPGRRYAVGGPDAVTGPELAAVVGAAIGRNLTYDPMPTEAFEEAMNGAMGAPAGTRLRAIYDRLGREPRAMAPDPSGRSDLGVEPESVGAWAARQDWRVDI